MIDGRPPRHAIQIGRKKWAAPARLDLEDGAGHRARRGVKRSPLIAVAIAVVVLGAAAAPSSS